MKYINKIAALALFMGSLVGSQISFAQSARMDLRTETVAASTVYVNEGAYQKLDLGSWRYVESLVIQAEGGSREGMVDVIVNGVVKGTIHVPGRDPSYVVTVRETIRSIEFRHLQGGTVYIRRIEARQNPTSLYDGGLTMGQAPLSEMARNQAAQISAKAIALVDRLQGFGNIDDYKDFLFPIKLVAARTYAKAQARGDLSYEVRNSLLALHAQIAYAKPFIEDSFERGEAFQLSLDLLTVGEELAALLK